MFETILIANRGEIACRVIRTAKRLGIRTVAVFSEADTDALHVRCADQAVAIGPANASESYLCGEKILEAARRSGAEAIHPGYGFLSENADFAEACTSAGICFIGPPAEAIRTMGRKDEAKRRMQQAGVPVLPGYHGSLQDPAALAKEAERIGFPILIKAVAGGGGRGMRQADRPSAFEAALASAQDEAQMAFGDTRVLLEQYLPRPRHIEVQIFADGHENVVHLFERDCSLQRRHQKVIEEAPAPGVDSVMREALGSAAVNASRAIGYVGAGTIEFIVDATDGLAGSPFYFMEMNTRLQVEHPITEAITNTDLVEWQLRVAAGEPLSCSQTALSIRGHAIEARIYAEDPSRDYLPQAGRLEHLSLPLQDEHVRVDSGVVQGDSVSAHYDPLLAKLVVHDLDRGAALRRLRRALESFEVVGVTTNLSLLSAVANHSAFAQAELDTGFLERHSDSLLANAEDSDMELIALACAGLLEARSQHSRSATDADPWSPWNDTHCFRLNEERLDVLRLRRGTQDLEIEVRFEDGDIGLRWPGASPRLHDIHLEANHVSAVVDGIRSHATFVDKGHAIHVLRGGRIVRLDRIANVAGIDEESTGEGVIRAPLPGKIITILVNEGEPVSRGQPLLQLEAMKMEYTLRADTEGVVEQLLVQKNEQVEEGATLLIVTNSDQRARA